MSRIVTIWLTQHLGAVVGKAFAQLDEGDRVDGPGDGCGDPTESGRTVELFGGGILVANAPVVRGRDEALLGRLLVLGGIGGEGSSISGRIGRRNIRTGTLVLRRHDREEWAGGEREENRKQEWREREEGKERREQKRRGEETASTTKDNHLPHR
jgi:hypothetical protein